MSMQLYATTNITTLLCVYVYIYTLMFTAHKMTQ